MIHLLQVPSIGQHQAKSQRTVDAIRKSQPWVTERGAEWVWKDTGKTCSHFLSFPAAGPLVQASPFLVWPVMLAFLPVLLTHLVHCFDDQACFQEAVFILHSIGVYRPQFRSQLWSVKTLPPETLWVKLPVESGMPEDLFGP